MGYFDSTKNRALWEIRLGELRKERAAREAGLSSGVSPARDQPQAQAANPSRVRVSYQQLLREEAKASGKMKKHEGRSAEHKKTQQYQKEAANDGKSL